MSLTRLLHAVIAVVSCLTITSSLKLVRVNIPPLVVKGEMARLECQYDLEADRLYSVLWYKDHEEFYRFVPRNEPKQHSYKLDGFKVDHHLSNEQHVLLRNLNLKATGVYRCEVSAEAPSFTSVHAEGKMEAIALPKDGPHITGQQKTYTFGEVLSLNCTSGRSYPPARLTWLINDIEVGADYESLINHHGLMRTLVSLSLEITPHYFEDGTMVVRCVATISAGRNSVREQRIEPVVDNREAHLLVQASCSNRSFLARAVLCFSCLLTLTLCQPT